MPVAGALTDRIGARLVVSAGLVVALLGTLAYTRIGVDTSNLYLAAALFVFGLGIGSTIMPSMAAAFQTLSREETPRATSALHAIQRIAGAIGTALFADRPPANRREQRTRLRGRHPGDVRALAAAALDGRDLRLRSARPSGLPRR